MVVLLRMASDVKRNFNLVEPGASGHLPLVPTLEG